MSVRGLVKVAIVVAIGAWLYYSGNAQSVMNYFSTDESTTNSPDSITDPVSLEKGALLNLIDAQSQLADNILKARNLNNRDEVKHLLTEFERLEVEYQELFSQANSRLSTGEANDISRKHRNVIRKLN